MCSRRRILNLSLPRQPKPEDENFAKSMKTIMMRNGLLTINGIEYQTKISDLEDLGELGNGTSGHVVKMKPKQTDSIIAVKVITNNYESYDSSVDFNMFRIFCS